MQVDKTSKYLGSIILGQISKKDVQKTCTMSQPRTSSAQAQIPGLELQGLGHGLTLVAER